MIDVFSLRDITVPPEGEEHCAHYKYYSREENEEITNDMENGHCAIAIHAEANAILQCAQFGIATKGAELYVTHEPCRNCALLIKGTGFRKCIFLREKED